MNLKPYNEVPDGIQKTIKMARMIDEKQITGFNNTDIWGQVGVGPYDISSLLSQSMSQIPRSTMTIAGSDLQIKLVGMLMHNHRKSVSSSDIYICPFLENGETTTIEYECHSSELPKPQKGLLKFEGV